MKWWFLGGIASTFCGLFVVAAMMMTAIGSPAGPTNALVGCAPKTGEATALDQADQRRNAKTIIEVGQKLKVPTRGLIVAIATAMQESTLHNLDHGDRDSVGLFQQRSAWGTFAQRTDPAQAAEMFYTGGHAGQRGLLDISGWQLMTIAGAAQAVQVSAFPSAYARWEPLATKVVDQVTGGGIQDCQRPKPAGGPCKVKDTSGYGNGQLPESVLCPIPWAPGQRLRGDAVNALIPLDAAYKARFGTHICITDSYRSLAQQRDVYARKPNLAAYPGTSEHGWGKALDLGCGLQVAGSPQDVWMHQHGDEYGWRHPGWAEPSGSRPESWHWEFGSAA